MKVKVEIFTYLQMIDIATSMCREFKDAARSPESLRKWLVAASDHGQQMGMIDCDSRRAYHRARYECSQLGLADHTTEAIIRLIMI